jgi:hypothetical protein
MKTIYIAGKIGGLPTEVYTDNFEEAEKTVIEMGYKPISPVKLPHDHDKTWESYMKEDLIALICCDAVFAQRNWISSRGATIEVNLAMNLKIPIIYG